LAARPRSPFANRLRKNQDRLRSWLKRSGVSCYRMYDADIPESNVAIDRYEDCAVVQEYAPPASVDPELAVLRLHEIVVDVARVLQIDPTAVFVKQRRRRVDDRQYERSGAGGPRQQVREGDLRLWVNLSDYLDTGLFLDHRRTRQLVRELAAGRRFLNLFGYTATVTLAAAAGGASSTTTVDLSNTYLRWARDNLALNDLDGERHHYVRDDVLAWLRHTRDTFDLAFVDPPTHSRSKRMRGDFDVQRDHGALIDAAMRRLTPDGVLLFSTHAHRFELDPALTGRYHVVDLTADTIDPDFARTPRVHQLWRITRAGSP
jgi:23S rRNA (guanine2445-N2)-methyltransferase / 23S rRNA (guanine2069-N7)-methyltransferase